MGYSTTVTIVDVEQIWMSSYMSCPILQLQAFVYSHSKITSCIFLALYHYIEGADNLWVQSNRGWVCSSRGNVWKLDVLLVELTPSLLEDSLHYLCCRHTARARQHHASFPQDVTQDVTLLDRQAVC